jgi:hypothetical protein
MGELKRGISKRGETVEEDTVDTVRSRQIPTRAVRSSPVQEIISRAGGHR